MDHRRGLLSLDGMDQKDRLLARNLSVRSEHRLPQDCRELCQIDLGNEIISDHTDRIHSAKSTFQIESRFRAFRVSVRLPLTVQAFCVSRWNDKL